MTIDINSIPGVDAMLAHAGWGAAIVLGSGLFLPWYVAMLIALGVAFVKEGSEALGIALWEPKQSWSSSMIDVLQFVYGIGPATGLLLIHHFVR